MKRLPFLVVCLIVLAVPLHARADSSADTGVALRLSGPYTPWVYHQYSDSGTTFAQTAPDLLSTIDWPGPPPGCSNSGGGCYNLSVTGYAQADLTHGTLKTSAASFAAYNYYGTNASSAPLPNYAESSASLSQTLTVTIPAGAGATYYFGATYDVSGTMYGTPTPPQDSHTWGQATVTYQGGVSVPASGDGPALGGYFDWSELTRDGAVTPYSTSGTFGMTLTGGTTEQTINVLLSLSLDSSSNTMGIMPAQAGSDFASTAHAALVYDPRLIVTADNPFPGLAPVPGPAPLLLLSPGLFALAALRRRLRK